MDSLITASARALAAGDPLGALKRVALRNDAPALALRGIAMAQLGDFPRAKELLRRAARAFTAKEVVARARCVVAEAEVALASRDLNWPAKTLDAARATLEEHGDRLNAAFARYLAVRRLLLIGHLDDVERMLADLDPAPFPPALRTAHELVIAGIAMRRLRTKEARAALMRAQQTARQARIAALTAEVESACRILNTPAAHRITRGGDRLLLLEEVETLVSSEAFVIDACRNVVRNANTLVSLTTRPVLFALARALGEAWPGDVPRDVLLTRAFGARLVDESHRARLRVEMAAAQDDSPAGRHHRDAARLRAKGSQPERGRGASTPRRRRAWRSPRLPHGRRVLVQFGPGPCPRCQPAHGAARARRISGRGQSAVLRPSASPPMDQSAPPRFHDNLVTPRSTCRVTGWTHE